MPEDFYDKVAKKFGGYGYGNDREPKYVKEFPAGDPEQVFKEKILELSGKDKIAFEYYRTYEDLDLFLQGVPIFQDFDSEKDRALLQEYANKFSSEKGIQLSRHRVVMVSEKN